MAARTIDVAALINGRKLTGFNYKLIILSWLITVFDGLDMMMVSFTAPYMRDEMGLSTTMLGNVFSAGTAGMVLGGFLFPWIGDRIGRRPTVILAAFLFGILTVGTGFATNYSSLLALRFLDGMAIGGMLPLAWALNIEFVPARMRATVVTVIMIGYSLGATIAAPLTNWIAPHYGWEGVYFVGGIGTLICATLLLFGLPESVRFLVNRGDRPERVVALLHQIDPAIEATPQDRFILGDEMAAPAAFHARELFRGPLAFVTPLIWLGYMASSMAIYFMSSWGPLVLETLNVPRGTAANVSAIGGMLGAIAGLLLMRFTDRHGPRAVAFYPALAVPILLLIGFGMLPAVLFLASFVLSIIVISGAHFGIISITGLFYPSSIRASGAGWAASIGKIAGVGGPIIGAMILSSGLPVIRSFVFLAICPAILFACALGLSVATRQIRKVAAHGG